MNQMIFESCMKIHNGFLTSESQRLLLHRIQNAKIEMSMPHEAVTIKVLGSIVWSKEVYDEQGRTVALGIRFEQMSPQMSGLVMVFANLLNTSS